MTGYPVLVRHNFEWYNPATWISAAIRKFTKSYWNHAAILLEEDGQLFVVEARSSGIVAATMEHWLEHRRNKVFAVGFPKEGTKAPEAIKKRIKSAYGKPYDTEALVLWQPLRILFGKWFGGTSKNGKLTCSEFVGLCWIEYFPNIWFHLTPADIEKCGLFDFTKVPQEG